MKILNISTERDFGSEIKLTFLRIRNYSLLQLSFSWGDYSTLPYIQISMGYGRLLDVLLIVGKFGFEMDLLGRSWRNQDSS